MKLLFKQRVFSWFDSYDIYYEDGSVAYTVKGKPSWGHKLMIYDAGGQELGMVQEKVLTLLPKFMMYQNGTNIGCLSKEFAFFKSVYNIDYNGWHIDGGFMEWDYTIVDSNGSMVAEIHKELLHWSDTYVIDVANPGDTLSALMVVLAIDAEKCSRSEG